MAGKGNKCIKNCGRQVSHAGNTCGTFNKASGTENCNSSNRSSSSLCINECGSRVSYKGNMCLTCAEAQGLSSGDVTGQSKARNAIKRDANDAAVAKYERLYSDVDNSIGAQAKAVAVAKSDLADKLSVIKKDIPERIITASIFFASEGRGHFVIHEGRESSLSNVSGKVECKKSIVKLVDRDGVSYWRNLDPNERKTIGPDAVDIYDATTSKTIANHVEWQVQLHVRDVLPDNVKLLQVRPGAGGCKGKPPYKVGVRFIVHNKYGNLPLGAIIKSGIPSGTEHISEAEKQASKKQRTLGEFFS